MRFLSRQSAVRLATSLALIAVTASTARAQWNYFIYSLPAPTDPLANNSGDGRPYAQLLCTGTTGTANQVDVQDDGGFNALCPAIGLPHNGWGADDGIGGFFQTFVNVSLPGTYSFSIDSDDGSNLFVDNTLVTGDPDNHAPDPPQTKTFFLSTGYHEVDVYYYEWTGGEEITADIDPLLSGSPVNPNLTATPEPASLVLLATGMLGLGGVQVRRRRRQTAA